MLEVLKRVAALTTIPFTVGGGIRDVASAAAVIQAGANKVSTSSAAFRHPEVIAEMIRELGAEKVTVAIDVDRNPSLPSGYEVFIDGGRTATGADALDWAKQIAGYGVRCILPTSKATDGVRTGFDLPLIRLIASATKAEVVASGGAGTMSSWVACTVKRSSGLGATSTKISPFSNTSRRFASSLIALSSFNETNDPSDRATRRRWPASVIAELPIPSASSFAAGDFPFAVSTSWPARCCSRST